MRQSVSRIEIRTAWIAAGLVALFAFALRFYLSEFSSLYPQDLNLPFRTKAILSLRNWILLLGMPAVLGAYAVTSGHRQVGWWSIGVSSGVALLLVPIIVNAMYAPVLQ